MIDIDMKQVFKAKMTGRPVDLGEISETGDDRFKVLAVLTEVGAMKESLAEGEDGEILTFYKANINIEYTAPDSDGNLKECKLIDGELLMLADDDTFTFEKLIAYTATEINTT